MSNQKKIVFQGEIGVNFYMVCWDVYFDYEVIFCVIFEDCFLVMVEGGVGFVMILIENFVVGCVVDIYYFFLGFNLYIIGEYFMLIWFQLMVLKGVILEGLIMV